MMWVTCEIKCFVEVEQKLTLQPWFMCVSNFTKNNKNDPKPLKFNLAATPDADVTAIRGFNIKRSGGAAALDWKPLS